MIIRLLIIKQFVLKMAVLIYQAMLDINLNILEQKL